MASTQVPQVAAEAELNAAMNAAESGNAAALELLRKAGCDVNPAVNDG